MESGGAMHSPTDHPQGLLHIPGCRLEGIGVDGEGSAENNEGSTIRGAGDGLFDG
tara:strand:- start:81 stop:245 length:165 start_codon:yes stop_codon:yes gene_type:complete